MEKLHKKIVKIIKNNSEMKQKMRAKHKKINRKNRRKKQTKVKSAKDTEGALAYNYFVLKRKACLKLQT